MILKVLRRKMCRSFTWSRGHADLRLGHTDIKFEEDNWESPTLGAWGGWQVMLDGLEITQFTYFLAVRRSRPVSYFGGIDLRAGANCRVLAGC